MPFAFPISTSWWHHRSKIALLLQLRNSDFPHRRKVVLLTPYCTSATISFITLSYLICLPGRTYISSATLKKLHSLFFLTCKPSHAGPCEGKKCVTFSSSDYLHLRGTTFKRKRTPPKSAKMSRRRKARCYWYEVCSFKMAFAGCMN